MATPFSLTSRKSLNNGATIPLIHLGVYLMSAADASAATTHALNAGYRAIDSAQMYHNEAAVGKAIAAFLANTPAVKREDVHYTTKLASNGTYEQARRSVRKSVEVCGLDYVDLFLLHSPYGGKAARLDSWRALEDAVDEGIVRSIGVSNFGEKHITELLASSPRIQPSVNQIEVHPFNTHATLTAFCADRAIAIQAYAPLARALRMQHPVVARLSQKYGCTPAQLLVRWSLQKGFITLPKSVREARIRENADVGAGRLGSEGLSGEDMAALEGCDEGLVTDWDPLDAP